MDEFLSDEWRVILRSEGRLVLYNSSNQSVSISQSDLHDSRQLIATTCSLCHQPLYRATVMPTPINPEVFTETDYFALLSSAENQIERSLPDPAILSHASSPVENMSDLPSSSNDLPTSAFNQGYYDRFFIETRKLGRGYRGSVFLCQHLLDGIILGDYAIKKVAVGNDHKWLYRMLQEVKIMERCRHVNVVEYKHAWLEMHELTRFGPQIPCLFILMEWINGGNLEEMVQIQCTENYSRSSPHRRRRLIESREHISDAFERERALKYGGIARLNGQRVRYLTRIEIFSLFSDICHGLLHLHRNGIVHRDLKPTNLLLKYTGGRNQIPTVLISDFGECEVVSESKFRTQVTGTMEFMPPELLEPDDAGNYLDDYSTHTDLWSLGMILYYLCFSTLPYSQIDDVDLLREEILSFECPSEFPDDYLEFEQEERVPKILKIIIRRLLSRNPTDRPAVQDVLRMMETDDYRIEKILSEGSLTNM